ncbi:MAG TPA: hypothetical protein VFR78_19425 [Pyrinomonadaceae bacterium]|nr:hypothetical protein [Pyrinomonadaceae bacterium]
MTNQNTRTLKRIAWGVIALHFVIVVLHSIAHEVLSVKATPAQLSFIIPVIIVTPLVAGFLLAKHYRAGMVLLAASMLGSFVFGLYYHFVADTIDHVSHVAHLQPAFWSQMFQATAYLLAISELVGVVVGSISLLNRRQSFNGYATRTDF